MDPLSVPEEGIVVVLRPLGMDEGGELPGQGGSQAECGEARVRGAHTSVKVRLQGPAHDRPASTCDRNLNVGDIFRIEARLSCLALGDLLVPRPLGGRVTRSLASAWPGS